jgi:hypothetical protein
MRKKKTSTTKNSKERIIRGIPIQLFETIEKLRI